LHFSILSKFNLLFLAYFLIHHLDLTKQGIYDTGMMTVLNGRAVLWKELISNAQSVVNSFKIMYIFVTTANEM